MSVEVLTERIKSKLNESFQSIWVGGEISGMTRASSGHIYFTLKDQRAAIKGIIWQSAAARIRFQPEEGMKVICRGYIDFYSERGTCQLIVQQLQPHGVGPLQLAFKQLHAKLLAEGLFEQNLKKPIPKIPRNIALITSPSGAAVRDFLQVLYRRWPAVDVTIVPVKVQGTGSAQQIARAIRLCSKFSLRPDVVVVTRGGGSLEDLWSFNEEVVCRAIHACPIPIVSGVGHEVDVTLADLTADVRALTPSEAAERLVPDQIEIKQWLANAKFRLQNGLKGRLQSAASQLHSLTMRPVIRRPLDRIHEQLRSLDESEARLSRSVATHLNESKNKIQQMAARLEGINPLAVLSRGYSITTNQQNSLVQGRNEVSIGDSILTRTAILKIQSRVEKIDLINE